METNIENRDTASQPREVSMAQEVNNCVGAKGVQSGDLAKPAMDSLAEELVDKIVVALKNANETSTLALLSQVSKKLHRIVVPHLYHTITVSFDNASFGVTSGNANKLARILYDQRDLAEQVKVLVFKRKNHELEELETDPIESTASIQEINRQGMFLMILRNTNDNTCQGLCETFTGLLPNIEALDSSDCILEEFFNNILLPTSLRSVDIAFRSDSSIPAMFHIFGHPSINKIALRGQNLREFDTQPQENAMRYIGLWDNIESDAQHLLLDNTWHPDDKAIVGDLAAACKSLKSLTLCHECFYLDDENVDMAIKQIAAFKEQVARESFQRFSLHLSDFEATFQVEPTGTSSSNESTPLEKLEWDRLVFSISGSQDNKHLASSVRILYAEDMVDDYDDLETPFFLNATSQALMYDDHANKSIHEGFKVITDAIRLFKYSTTLTVMIGRRLNPEKIEKMRKDCGRLGLEFDFIPGA